MLHFYIPKITEREIKKTVSFTTASKRIKYLVMNLAKKVKELLELDMEQWTGSKLRKEYIKAEYCHPAYLTYMQSTSWQMLGWKKCKLESRLLGEISTTSDTQMIPSLWQKVKRKKRAS